jgi:hypothetical protein
VEELNRILQSVLKKLKVITQSSESKWKIIKGVRNTTKHHHHRDATVKPSDRVASTAEEGDRLAVSNAGHHLAMKHCPDPALTITTDMVTDIMKWAKDRFAGTAANDLQVWNIIMDITATVIMASVGITLMDTMDSTTIMDHIITADAAEWVQDPRSVIVMDHHSEATDHRLTEAITRTLLAAVSPNAVTPSTSRLLTTKKNIKQAKTNAKPTTVTSSSIPT